MLCWERYREWTSRQFFSVGVPLAVAGLALCAPWPFREGLPPFWDGFCVGLGAAMTGCSVAFNVLGLCRFREEWGRG
jgi:hypothetical protein